MTTLRLQPWYIRHATIARAHGRVRQHQCGFYLILSLGVILCRFMHFGSRSRPYALRLTEFQLQHTVISASVSMQLQPQYFQTATAACAHFCLSIISVSIISLSSRRCTRVLPFKQVHSLLNLVFSGIAFNDDLTSARADINSFCRNCCAAGGGISSNQLITSPQPLHHSTPA